MVLRGASVALPEEIRERLGYMPIATLARKLVRSMAAVIQGVIPMTKDSLRPVGRHVEPRWLPDPEMFERDRALVVRLALPGMTRNGISATVTAVGLVVEGERKREPNENNDGMYATEPRYRRFYRLIPLPDGAKAESVTASFKDGALEFTVPMAPAARAVETRKVAIECESDSETGKAAA